MDSVIVTADLDHYSVPARELHSSLWLEMIQHPDGRIPSTPINVIKFIPQWAAVHHISSVMYTTAMQQLEGSRDLDDWVPVEKVYRSISALCINTH
jgi:hypothetical protein